jgi:hypothetical protein
LVGSSSPPSPTTQSCTKGDFPDYVMAPRPLKKWHRRCCTSTCRRRRASLITAFEQGPGKWRVSIVAANGRPLKTNDRQLLESVTSANLSSAVDALTLAMEAIDAAGLFFGNTNPKSERFWRVLRVGIGGSTGLMRDRSNSAVRVERTQDNCATIRFEIC